jgi:hypothetical protein
MAAIVMILRIALILFLIFSSSRAELRRIHARDPAIIGQSQINARVLQGLDLKCRRSPGGKRKPSGLLQSLALSQQRIEGAA